MKKITLAMLIGLMFTLAITDFISFSESYNSIQTGVLRLHILANSDSYEDQHLKLIVRDEVLKECSWIFEGTKGIEQSEEAVRKNLGYIQRTAQKALAENGSTQSVTCSLVNMEFDDREYANVTMPAGNYDAVRITIGKAQGKNWWCVMYPPLCVPAAEATEENYFSEEELDIMKNPRKYRAKFKCVELYEQLTEKE